MPDDQAPTAPDTQPEVPRPEVSAAAAPLPAEPQSVDHPQPAPAPDQAPGADTNPAPVPLPPLPDTTDDQPDKPPRTAAAGLAFIFSWIIFPLLAVFILHFFVFQAYHVVGTSMLSTLEPNDYLIISKVADTTSAIKHNLLGQHTSYIPARNEIIVFHYPLDPTLTFVKRVIGLPGDHVIITGGQVTIYNAQHPAGFSPNTGYEPAGTQTDGSVDEIVPPGNVFVLGDNRTPGGSFDSRDWGNLPSNDIIGNVVLRLLPLDQLRTF